MHITENLITPLSFADEHIAADWVRNASSLAIPRGEPTIVANLSGDPVVVAGPRGAGPKKSYILPWRSTILEDTTILSGDSLVFLRIVNPINLGGVIRSSRWQHTSNVFPGYPSSVPLWRSLQEEVNIVSVDPVAFATMGALTGSPVSFQTKVNLWYSPQQTDCRIHNQHTFLEVHTQVFGVGRMQKFHENSECTLYEDVILSPGGTHDPFMEIAPNGSFIYPWHRYYSDNDCIWMAIELHPLATPAS